MTDNELSAAIAVAKGEVKLIQTTFKNSHNGMIYWPADMLHRHRAWAEPDGTEELFRNAYRHVKPYASDTNRASELLKELVESGERVTIKIDKGGCTISSDTIDFEETTLARAICRAYIIFFWIKREA